MFCAVYCSRKRFILPNFMRGRATKTDTSYLPVNLLDKSGSIIKHKAAQTIPFYKPTNRKGIPSAQHAII
ncbi:MAG: hypothetical protein ABIN89_16405 [Chitinophagaceae bacterium]